MKRDLGLLESRVFDVLVVGGGIHGACVAWDAALRGLSVALIDKGDFGHATSANSLKIIHGGLRYLQDPDLALARTMVRERAAFMRVAPHLVHPIPCVMPLYRGLRATRSAMTLALALSDALGFDQNRRASLDKHLPRGRVVSRGEALRMLPGVREEGLAGAAEWHECQVYNSERLTLSFVLAAAELGAAAANYVEATAFAVDCNSVVGVKARDLLSGATFEVRSRVTVNTAGPWADCVLGLLGKPTAGERLRLSRAVNLVTRQIAPGRIAALPAQLHIGDGQSEPNDGSRLLLMAAWRRHSLLGTLHLPANEPLPECQVQETEIDDIIAHFNHAYPGAGIARADVRSVHTGLLPAADGDGARGVRLLRKPRIVDHARQDGIRGLVTVVGVKYSLARRAAQEAVDLVLRRLRQEDRPCLTAQAPVAGGKIEGFSDFLEHEAERRQGELATETVRHLVSTYGSGYTAIVDYIKRDRGQGQRLTEGLEVTRAEIVHAIREEMAVKLADVVFRRTELGAAEYPGDACLRACADVFGSELGWTQTKRSQEMHEVRSRFLLAA